jgi:hypothetical protein
MRRGVGGIAGFFARRVVNQFPCRIPQPEEQPSIRGFKKMPIRWRRPPAQLAAKWKYTIEVDGYDCDKCGIIKSFIFITLSKKTL